MPSKKIETAARSPIRSPCTYIYVFTSLVRAVKYRNREGTSVSSKISLVKALNVITKFQIRHYTFCKSQSVYEDLYFHNSFGTLDRFLVLTQLHSVDA